MVDPALLGLALTGALGVSALRGFFQGALKTLEAFGLQNDLFKYKKSEEFDKCDVQELKLISAEQPFFEKIYLFWG